MTGQLRSDSNTLVAVLGGVDQYTFRAGGSQAANPTDVCTMGMSKLAQAVAQATTSGTALDFTGIPAWAKRVTLNFDSLSTNAAGGAAILVQLGAGSVQTTGYRGGSLQVVGATASATNSTAGFAFAGSGAANVVNGSIVFTLLSGNIWAAQGYAQFSNTAAAASVGGSVTLTGALDRLRLTTSNGTDAFDLGTVNIMWE